MAGVACGDCRAATPAIGKYILGVDVSSEIFLIVYRKFWDLLDDLLPHLLAV